MANIDHKDIDDAATTCHTPQGFSDASNDTLLTKDTAGNLVWEAASSFAQRSGDDRPHGMSYISAAAANAVAVATEYEQVAGTWTNVEADDVTWDTDHFVITTAGAYLIYLTGGMTIATNADVVSIDINRESTIANGNEQGFSPWVAKADANAAQFPVGGTWYMDDLEVGDKITPMITTDTGGSVTVDYCQMTLIYLHD